MASSPAASAFTGWILDQTRNQYYYYDEQEGAYIYQTGEKIYITAPAAAHSASAADPSTDEHAPRHLPHVGTSAPDVDDLAEDLGATTLGGAYTYGSAYIPGPAVEITDPALANLGLQATGKLRGSRGVNDALFPDYKRRRDGRSFFVTGKVFKTLWPELLGQANESVTITSEARFNEQIATKIRWFIVVRPGPNHCTCLPIVTYNRQGVAKHGVVKGHHAIAYTSQNEPPPEKSEKPTGRDIMLPGIRIVPNSKNRRTKLDKMSRVDFSRMYTVEHNVKVFDFGDVHKAHLSRLQSQWIGAITGDAGGLSSAKNVPGLEQDPSMGQDDDYDEYDDDPPEEEEHARAGYRPTGYAQDSSRRTDTSYSQGTSTSRRAEPPASSRQGSSSNRRQEAGSSRRQEASSSRRQDPYYGK